MLKPLAMYRLDSQAIIQLSDKTGYSYTLAQKGNGIKDLKYLDIASCYKHQHAFVDLKSDHFMTVTFNSQRCNILAS